MSENKYGEVKTRKNIFPNDAREIVKKGTIGILISQCPVSEKTKGILAEVSIPSEKCTYFGKAVHLLPVN